MAPTPRLVTSLMAPAYVFSNGVWELILGAPPASFGQYYGDTIGDLTGRQIGESETLTLGGGQGATFIGDSVGLYDRAQGGADTIITEVRGNTVIGDALLMHDRSVGGTDTITASGSGVDVYGDASLMFDSAQGGDDSTMLAGDSTIRAAFGDAGEMSGWARAGDNLIVAQGRAVGTTLTGDAAKLSDHARGGDDLLVAGEVAEFFGSQYSYIYGDAFELFGHAHGGNDVLVGGPDRDVMWGDAEVMGSKARGGNDTFVFLPGSGNDTVCDFRHGEDVIDLAAYGVSAISELEIEIIDGNSVVHLGTQDSLALVGVSQLSDSDFLFA